MKKLRRARVTAIVVLLAAMILAVLPAWGLGIQLYRMYCWVGIDQGVSKAVAGTLGAAGLAIIWVVAVFAIANVIEGFGDE